MKVLFRYSLLATIVTFVAMGCSKTTKPNDEPDVSNFSMSAITALVPGQTADVKIISTTLADGNYTAEYSLLGSNQGVGLTSPLTMHNKNGVFTTGVLTYSGMTSLTLTSLKNSQGKITYLKRDNVVIFTSATHDSTGYMRGLVDGNLAFKATDVTCGLDVRQLTINATEWDPQISGITLKLDNFYWQPGTFYFWALDTATLVNGSARYIAPGSAETKTASWGFLKIVDTYPLMTGTFQFTNPDSVKIYGSFTVKSPAP